MSIGPVATYAKRPVSFVEAGRFFWLEEGQGLSLANVGAVMAKFR